MSTARRAERLLSWGGPQALEGTGALACRCRARAGGTRLDAETWWLVSGGDLAVLFASTALPTCLRGLRVSPRRGTTPGPTTHPQARHAALDSANAHRLRRAARNWSQPRGLEETLTPGGWMIGEHVSMAGGERVERAVCSPVLLAGDGSGWRGATPAPSVRAARSGARGEMPAAPVSAVRAADAGLHALHARSRRAEMLDTPPRG